MAKPEDRPTAAQMAAAADGGDAVCPKCGCRDFRTPRTWHVKEPGVFAKRTRVCRHCGEVVCTTREIADE